MRLLLITFGILAILCGCKKSSPGSPEPAIKTIVGKWKRVAYEKTVNGQKIWEEITGDSKYNYLVFRFDGVILDSDGLPGCCVPAEYSVNGILFRVIPKAAIPENPSCALMDCVGCPSWNIEQTGDELILGLCLNFPRSKFVRE